LGPMRARGSGPDFLFALADAGHTFLNGGSTVPFSVIDRMPGIHSLL
jgi:hypothetical protein